MREYSEDDRAKARQICSLEMHRIQEAQTAEQINEKGWLALGCIQGVYAAGAVSVDEHCQFIKELAAAEVRRLTELGFISDLRCEPHSDDKRPASPSLA
jgi:hypothetical protein